MWKVLSDFSAHKNGFYTFLLDLTFFTYARISACYACDHTWTLFLVKYCKVDDLGYFSDFQFAQPLKIPPLSTAVFIGA